MLPCVNSRIIVSVIAALITGIAIALQSSVGGRAGLAVGSIRTGLLINLMGGATALVVIIILWLTGNWPAQSAFVSQDGSLWTNVYLLTLLGGWFGITIVSGVTFSVQGVGVTAGLSAVILAQLIAGSILDAVGGAGVAAAIDVRRVLGLVAMAIGVWLLVPRS
ncbi:MAG: DMT family transporter [Spirochaetaceae bacterium]